MIREAMIRLAQREAAIPAIDVLVAVGGTLCLSRVLCWLRDSTRDAAAVAHSVERRI